MGQRQNRALSNAGWKWADSCLRTSFGYAIVSGMDYGRAALALAEMLSMRSKNKRKVTYTEEKATALTELRPREWAIHSKANEKDAFYPAN